MNGCNYVGIATQTEFLGVLGVVGPIARCHDNGTDLDVIGLRHPIHIDSAYFTGIFTGQAFRADAAVQTARRFGHGLGFGVALIDFFKTVSVIERQTTSGYARGWNKLAFQNPVIEFLLGKVCDGVFRFRDIHLLATQVTLYRCRGFMTGSDGFDNKRGSADRVTGSEYTRVAGGESIGVNIERIVSIDFYVTGLGDQGKPGLLASGEDNHISFNDKLGAFYYIGNPAPVIVDVELVNTLAFNSSNVATAVILDSQEIQRSIQRDALLVSAGHFFRTCRDRIFALTHGDLNIGSSEAAGGTSHVHSYIPATYNHHAFSFHIRARVTSRAIQLVEANVTQKRSVDQNSTQIITRNRQAITFVCTHRNQYGPKTIRQ